MKHTKEELLEQKNELLEVIQMFKKLLDDGDIIRDISNDNDFSYFTKQGIRITQAVVAMENAIQKATQ